MLATEIETEIAELAGRYGAPRRVEVELAGRPFDPLTRTDRYGEVCMVVRRPSGGLLTAIKTFYPDGAFRLLTGGVGYGERIGEALLREIAEETGLDVVVRRFLAVVEYRLQGMGDGEWGLAGRKSIPHRPYPSPGAFATFAFLLDEVGGALTVSDPGERIGAFREIGVAELPALADTLEHVPDQIDEEIGGSWRDWGRFRATIHRVVYEELASEISDRTSGEGE